MFPTNVSNWGGTIYNVWTGGWSHTGHTDNAGKNLFARILKMRGNVFMYIHM